MKFESKIKKIMEVREYVSDCEDGINIKINDITRTDNDKLLNINGASVLKDSECVGDFSIYGEFNEDNDNRRFVLNIPFNLIDHLDKIIDAIKSIDNNEYETVEEYSYEICERESREEMISKPIDPDTPVVEA